MATQWLQDCLGYHNRCGNGPESLLPTRVLDVDSPIVRLYVSCGEKAQYVCLSHCWGLSQIIITTAKTLQDRISGIPWTSLSRTFQEAITFTRSLKVRYLWIDSLCIVQDDKHDWEQEAARIAMIYENSFLTLAATKSTNGQGGMFSNLNVHELVVNVHDTSYHLYVRRLIKHLHNDPQEFPLLSRAWVLQERLLSPRVLHFTNGELAWECREDMHCECDRLSDDSTNAADTEKAKFSDALANASTSILRKTWHEIVSTYSGLNLTKPSDKFPAISGLVKALSRHWTITPVHSNILRTSQDNRCLAGLWQQTFLHDLLWRTRIDWRCARPTTWRAPSWSWASINTKVYFEDAKDGYESSDSAEVHDVICDPAGSDPTGELKMKSSSLVISGYLTPAWLLFSWDGDGIRWIKHHLLTTSGPEPNVFYPDYLYCEEDPPAFYSEAVHCLLLSAGRISHFSLILRCLDPGEQVYERMGLVEQFSHHLGIWEDETGGPLDKTKHPWYKALQEKSRVTIV